MNKLAVLDSGTGYHIVSLHGVFAPYFHRVIYLPRLSAQDLEGVRVLIIPCASSLEQLMAKKEIFTQFLARGGVLFVGGRNAPERWLDGIKAVKLPFNYWWWLDERARIDLKCHAPDYGLFKYERFENCLWHYHGGYELPRGAQNIIAHEGTGESVFFDCNGFGGGRLILTSLDPFYHHGSFFMPNATKLLRALLEFLTKDIE